MRLLLYFIEIHRNVLSELNCVATKIDPKYLVGESTSWNDDRKYPRYDFTALLKVPKSEFYAKFKNFSKDEDQYYPNFKIEDTELKKIYFDKKDLNK